MVVQLIDILLQNAVESSIVDSFKNWKENQERKKKVEEHDEEILKKYGEKIYYNALEGFLVSKGVLQHFYKDFCSNIIRHNRSINDASQDATDKFLNEKPLYEYYRNEIRDLIQDSFCYLFFLYTQKDSPNYINEHINQIYILLSDRFNDFPTRDEIKNIIRQVMDENNQILADKKDFQLRPIRLLGDHGDYVADRNTDDHIYTLLEENNIICVKGFGGVGKTISCRRNIFKYGNDHNTSILEINCDEDYIDKKIDYIIQRKILAVPDDIAGITAHKNYLLNYGISDYLNKLISNGILIIYFDNYQSQNNNIVNTFYNEYNIIKGKLKLVFSCRPMFYSPEESLGGKSMELTVIKDVNMCSKIFVKYANIIDNTQLDNLNAFFGRNTNLKNPFVIKFLAKCYLTNRTDLNSFMNDVEVAINNIEYSDYDYIPLVKKLLEKYFLKNNIFSQTDICFLHFISICYGRILSSEAKEICRILKKYEKNVNIEIFIDYFSSENYIDLHDILADAVKKYVESELENRFKDTLYDFYATIICRFFLNKTRLGRTNVFDKLTNIILPFSKLIRYLESKNDIDNYKELYRVLTEGYNNLAYLQISIQQNYFDVKEALAFSKKAKDNIRRKLNMFDTQNHNEFFANCNCDNCLEACTNSNMKWGCYFKENIYCNVYVKCNANSYNPFDPANFGTNVIEAMRDIDTSLDRYTKYGDFDSNKLTMRQNEFTYTQSLSYYKLSCAYNNEDYISHAYDYLEINIPSIVSLINSIFNTNLSDQYQSKAIKDITEQCAQIFINDDNSKKDGLILKEEIKNLTMSLLLYCIYSVKQGNYSDFEQELLDSLDLMMTSTFSGDELSRDNQRSNIARVVKALIYINNTNYKNAFVEIRSILNNLNRQSYALEAWLLLRKLFLNNDSNDLFISLKESYLRTRTENKVIFSDIDENTTLQDFSDMLFAKINRMIMTFYSVDKDRMNDFDKYDELLYYFITT